MLYGIKNILTQFPKQKKNIYKVFARWSSLENIFSICGLIDWWVLKERQSKLLHVWMLAYRVFCMMIKFYWVML